MSRSFPPNALNWHMRRIGYLRVSTEEQRPDRQIDGLTELCDEIFVEIVSAASRDRPIYETVTSHLQTGDALVVWDLDRAYRSSSQALNELERLTARGVAIHIVNLAIDTTTPAGFFVFTMLAALATFERQTLSVRTREGLAAARRRGQVLGRPRKLSGADILLATERIAAGATVGNVAGQLGVAEWTLRRSIRRSKQELAG